MFNIGDIVCSVFPPQGCGAPWKIEKSKDLGSVMGYWGTYLAGPKKDQEAFGFTPNAVREDAHPEEEISLILASELPKETLEKASQNYTFQIEVTLEQLELMQMTMEVWSRVGMGQFQDVISILDYNKEYLHSLKELGVYKKLLELLREMETIYRDAQLPSGVGHCRTSDLAWEMYQVIRNSLAWDRIGNPTEVAAKDVIWNRFDKPVKYTPVPMIKIIKQIQE